MERKLTRPPKPPVGAHKNNPPVNVNICLKLNYQCIKCKECGGVCPEDKDINEPYPQFTCKKGNYEKKAIYHQWSCPMFTPER